MNLNEIHMNLNEIHMNLNEIHMNLNEIHMNLNEIHMNLNEIHMNLNEIHMKLNQESLFCMSFSPFRPLRPFAIASASMMMSIQYRYYRCAIHMSMRAHWFEVGKAAHIRFVAQ